MSLRWLPPALPGGPPGNYSVLSSDPSREDSVAPETRCVAWPEYVCHTVDKVGRTSELAVTATSLPGHQRGDTARISVNTTPGGGPCSYQPELTVLYTHCQYVKRPEVGNLQDKGRPHHQSLVYGGTAAPSLDRRYGH